jgi:hypothetical protein
VLEKHIQTANRLFHRKTEKTDTTKCPWQGAPFTFDVAIYTQKWKHTKVEGVKKGGCGAEGSSQRR